MKLTVEERPDAADIEVAITCPAIDRRVRAIVNAANAVDRRLVGTSGAGTFLVDADEVLYAETVDGRTFLYEADRCACSSWKRPWPAPSSSAPPNRCS